MGAAGFGFWGVRLETRARHSRRQKHRGRLLALTVVAALVSSLVVALPAAVASAAEEPVPSERERAMALLLSGGPSVARAAEVALLGSDAQLRAFLTVGAFQAQEMTAPFPRSEFVNQRSAAFNQ